VDNAGNESLQGDVDYAATLNIDLDLAARQNITLTGNIILGTLAGSRAAAGTMKAVELRLTASGGTRTITLAGGFVAGGLALAIASLADGESCVVAVESAGANESDTTWGFAPLEAV
jgi:hypothetical protein